VAFIRQHSRRRIERVRIRRILAERHEEDRILLSNAIIHSLLQRRFLFSNEIVVADDVVDFHGAGRSIRTPPRIRQEYSFVQMIVFLPKMFYTSALMPRRKNSWADELLLAPWWVSAGIALLACMMLPSVLPPAAVKSGLIVLIAFALLAISAMSALRSLRSRLLLNAQTGLDSLRDLSWKRFEDVLAEAYRRQGYHVKEMLGAGADGGVDLLLRKSGQLVVVQCKRWRGKPVPVQIVRELYGVMIDQRASAAKIVATTSFTPDAVAFAKGKPIELVDSKALLRLVRNVQTSCRLTMSVEEPGHLTPMCPRCGKLMVLREARRGAYSGEKFWGCVNYPKCRGIRQL
jgi:restriction system protein